MLIDALWPDSEGDAGYHALEMALHRLRRLLGARDAVRMEGGKLSLNRDQLRVDMWEFEEELQRSHDPEAKNSKGSAFSDVSIKGIFSSTRPKKPRS